MGHLSTKGFLAASIAALSLAVCPVATGKDRTAECGPWEFTANAETEGGTEPQASLPCKNDVAIVTICVAGDFIGGLRYYASETSGQEQGYRQFRFTIDRQSFDMWLRLEELDGAWAGYTEFAHPLFTAMQSEKGPMEVTDVAGKTTDVLPLAGAAKAFDNLLKACQPSE